MVAAPIALIPLRVVQGSSAGAGWGGAALWPSSTPPRNRRGLSGAYPPVGVPVGRVLATGVLWGCPP